MIKEIQQISIIALILRLCYDIFNIFINHITKKENELVIVRHEIEETHVFNESTPYETYYNIWPVVLGFTCASCFVLSWFLWLAKRVLSRKLGKEGTRKCKKNDVPSSSKYFNSSKFHKKNCPDANDVSEVSFTHFPNEVNQNFSYQEVDPPYKINHTNPTIYRTQVQNESFLPIPKPNMLDTGMFQFSSALDMLNNETSSSLQQVDCSNSKLLSDVKENRNIAKVGLPMPRNLYAEENRGCKLKFTKEYYDCKSRIIVDEETNIKSNTNEMSIQLQDDKIMEFLSSFQNNVRFLPKYSSCEKSTSAQFLTYTDSDLESFEKRLEKVEQELKSTEDKMSNCDHRINRTEKELVDLHEQIHTIYSKMEENNKTDVIIVSRVSKEPEEVINIENKAISISDTDDTEVISLANSEKENFKSELKNLHEISCSQTEDDTNGDDDEIITTGRNNAFQNSGMFLSKIKKKTVALETMLENKCGSTIRTRTRKKAPLLNVPPHIVPPHKRSAFACTNSRSDLIKIKKRLYPKVQTRII